MWSPLLEGKPAETAFATIAGIVESITGSARSTSNAEAQPCSIDGACLASGQAGLAIFFAYLAQVDGFESSTQAADGFVDAAIDAVARTNMSASLYGGFPGIAWAIAHLSDQLFDQFDDLNAEVDATLQQYVELSPWPGEYDLVTGLVGIGVYALERLPHSSGAELLARVVLKLHEIAERNEDGATWFTAPSLLPDWQRRVCPHGYYNLGLAHGVPGVIAMLAGACRAQIADDVARPLLDDAVRWLLSQRLPNSAPSAFSTWAGRGLSAHHSRSAWCYGDPGIAAALLCAAKAVDHPDWRANALAIARKAADRPSNDTGVRDAGLCHGAAGLGHLFNRMFHITGDTHLGEAARFWLTRALNMREPGTGIGGYRAFFPREDGTEQWVNEPGILSGSVGIALALLAACTSIEPSWDRMLLVSLRSDMPAPATS